MRSEKVFKKIVWKKCLAKKQGFSLIETLVAVAIFAFVITMFTGMFASFLKNYAQARKMQKNMENAQYALGLVAKNIRTSNVVAYQYKGSAYCTESQTNVALCSNGVVNGQSEIIIWDNSQNKCLGYKITGLAGTMQVGQAVAADLSACKAATASAANFNYVNNDLALDISSGSIIVDQNIFTAGSAGKVVISLNVGTMALGDAASNSSIVQTTVSVRGIRQ